MGRVEFQPTKFGLEPYFNKYEATPFSYEEEGMFAIVFPKRDGVVVDNEITIGRNSKDGLTLINSALISREHIQIFVRNGKLFIKDLSSKNGVQILNNRDGVEQQLHDVVELSTGLYIQLAKNVQFRYKVFIVRSNKAGKYEVQFIAIQPEPAYV